MQIQDKPVGIKGQVKLIFRDAKTGKITKESEWIDNLIANVGLYSIASNFCSKNLLAAPGQIQYCAVGDGVTPPFIAGTTLDNEIERVTISTASDNINNIAEIRAFYNTTQANGTLTELGLFGDNATGAADSGTLFQWIAFAFTKTSSETLTVISRITVSYV